MKTKGRPHSDAGNFPRRHERFTAGKNGVWIIDVDGLRIVHLGDLGHLLDKAQLKKLGDVDILMIPVGGVTRSTASKPTSCASKSSRDATCCRCTTGT